MRLLSKTRPWNALWRSFQSKALYRSVAGEWKGFAYVYLAIVLIFSWALVGLKVQFIVRDHIDQALIPVVDDLPSVSSAEKSDGSKVGDDGKKHSSIYFPDGSLVKDTRNKKTGKLIIHYDFSDNPEMPDRNQDGLFIYNKTMFYQWKGTRRLYSSRTASLSNHEKSEGSVFSTESQSTAEEDDDAVSNLDDAKLDEELGKQIAEFEEGKKTTRASLDQLKKDSGVIVCLAGWVVSSILLGGASHLVAFFGKLVSIFSNAPLAYDQLVRLAVVSVTPALWLDIVQKMVGLGIPAWTFFFVVLWLAYMTFAVRANSASELIRYADPESLKSTAKLL